MLMIRCCPAAVAFCAAFAWALSPAAAQEESLEFAERFAFADNRASVLDELVPGSEGAYYYECLQLQHSGDLDKVAAVIAAWRQNYGSGALITEIENRQALLSFPSSPEGTFDYLADQLSLRFDHRRQIAGEPAELPSELDPDLVTWQSFAQRGLQKNSQTFDFFKAQGLDRLSVKGLSEELLHSLLKRLRRPDLPELPELIVRDLKSRVSRGFGSLPIHQALLLEQLRHCAELSPQLLEDREFVDAWMQRLRPGAEDDWSADGEDRGPYLERLVSFSERLSAAHNSLKAHVRYWQLHHDLRQGVFQKDRFLRYLRLPRLDALGNEDYAGRVASSQEVIRLGQSFATGLPVVQNDRPLIESYLSHFFRQGEHFEPFTDLLREGFVRRFYAETGLLYGLGDPNEFDRLFDDREGLQDLRDRVEIEFADSQALTFAAQDNVTIDLDVKNVDTLLVKVFEIDTVGFYRTEEREVGTDVVLDGLVANEEFTVSDTESPMRRVRRSFELPSLNRPGVYVVEFVGNGLASRAVIHKGSLRFVERVGAAGHVFRVLDDEGEQLGDATIRVGGHLYTADEQGEFVVPFSSVGGSRSMVIAHGDRATLAHFEHRSERYELKASLMVDREGLMEGEAARILLRPSLWVSGEMASLELLEEPVLHLDLEDRHGLVSTREITGLDLSYDKEWVEDIVIPGDIARVSGQLTGSVKNLSRGETDVLASDVVTFPVNAMDGTAEVSGPVLARTEQGYVLDVLGKGGEGLAARGVTLALYHRGFVDPFIVSLQTDARGRITLGELPELSEVRLLGKSDSFDRWELLEDIAVLPKSLNGAVGETLRLPYLGGATVADRSVLSLFELHGGAYAVNRLDHAKLVNGYIELTDLPAGQYELFLKGSQEAVDISVSDGQRQGEWIIGPRRILPAPTEPLLQINDVSLRDNALTVSLAGTSADARVHVLVSRYLSGFDPWLFLGTTQPASKAERWTERPESAFVAGRQLSDEVRYILERRFATTFPGNMLRRPSLLLNPWAMELAGSTVGVGEGGGAFGGRGKMGSRGRVAGSLHGPPPTSVRSPNVFANLEFLPQPSVTLANLRPDEQGLVSVPRSALGAGQLVSVVAIQGNQTVFRSLSLPEQPLEPRELRLAEALDGDRHVSEQRRIELLGAGETAVIEDRASAQAESFYSLGSVFQLFKALGGGTELAEFAELMNWPELTEEQRRSFYGEFACHELHLFLHQKDRPFFDADVRPFLANKLGKTFLDHWLLEDDLSPYWQPWEYSQLNVVERILLGRRFPERADSVARQLADLQELEAPQEQLVRQRFEVALGGVDLGGTSSLGTALADDVIEEVIEEANLFMRASVAARAAGPSAADKLDQLTALGYLGDSTDSESVTVREEKAQADAGRRDHQRRFFSGPEQTREYVEHNYWQRVIEEQGPRLIPANSFWVDCAGTKAGTPFVSTQITEPVNSINEMLLALALLDLPFSGEGLATEQQGNSMTLTAQGPTLVVRKELEDTPLSPEPAQLLVGQSDFLLHDRYTDEGLVRSVTGELLTGLAYGCEVVVTNPSAVPMSLELLTQIPQGALPLMKGRTTESREFRLGAYATQSFEYSYYFPAAGTFDHYPAQISNGSEVLAFARGRTLTVASERSSEDRTSWEYISQQGEIPALLGHLAQANLYRTDLSRLAWRLSDRAVFDQIIALLKSRHVFSPVVWSYGVYHRDAGATEELLSQTAHFVESCGPWLDSPLLSIDPIARRFYQHIEYAPLFNARAHRLGASRKILNESQLEQYTALLLRLAHQPKLESEDWLEVTYALLLQDRVAEALASFDRVDRGDLETQLQLDALGAYLAFYRGDLAGARALAEAHLDHPVARWRERFAEMIAQLDEAAGLGGDALEGSGLSGQSALVASEPSLELEVAQGVLTLHHENLEQCEVRYSQRDLELLFSSDPFGSKGSAGVAAIRPNRSDVLTFDEDKGVAVVSLPPELVRENLLIEVRAAGLVRRAVSEPSGLTVQLIQNYGQLKVSSAQTGQALPGAYIKVYSQLADGEVLFHKDGYTDLRGRFDYVSLSAQTGEPERYSILVISESDGAVVREVDAPLL